MTILCPKCYKYKNGPCRKKGFQPIFFRQISLPSALRRREHVRREFLINTICIFFKSHKAQTVSHKNFIFLRHDIFERSSLNHNGLIDETTVKGKELGPVISIKDHIHPTMTMPFSIIPNNERGIDQPHAKMNA